MTRSRRLLSSQNLLRLFVLALPALPACSGCNETSIVAQQPVPEEADGDAEPFTNDWGAWLSMAVSEDGEPTLAYYDRTKGALGYATATMTDGEITWAHEEVDGYANEEGLDTGDRGKYASMAVAADGTVWIAYYDVLNKSLRYAKKDPVEGTWESGVADVGGGSSPDAGQFASLALDASGYPVIAHYDAGKGQLRIARYSASSNSFTGSVVDEGEAPPADTGGEELDADVGQFARLYIESGVEYLAYYDAANGALKLAWGTAGNYTIDTVDSDGDVGQWPDMMIRSGTIHIAYHDVGEQQLMYAAGEPGNWEIEVADSSDHVGADTAMYLNGSYPAIVYFDGRNNDMRSSWRGSDGWQSSRVTGEQGALGFHNEVVTANGVIYAACYDYTNRTVWFSTLD